MLGSAAQWNCQFKEIHSFHILQLSNVWLARKSRTKASFSHLPLSVLREVSHESFGLHISRDVSHESFVFTSWTFSFWGMSRTKASFSSNFNLSVFAEDARKAIVFCRCTNIFLQNKTSEGMRKLCSARRLLYTICQQGSFSNFGRCWFCTESSRFLQTSCTYFYFFCNFLQRHCHWKLRFHIFNFQFLRPFVRNSLVFCNVWNSQIALREVAAWKLQVAC